MASTDTPRAGGYRWPAEWEPHQATWLAWPHNLETWPGRFEPIPGIFTEFIRTLAQYEPVEVLAGGQQVMQQAGQSVGGVANVTLHDIPTNDVWIRDYGPLFLQSSDQPPAAVNWQFNSWGGKYPPWDRDNAAGPQIVRRLGYRSFAPQVVLEGGSIDGNGAGAVLTTESCLLDPRRNATFDREQAAALLYEYCVADEVIWIAGGPMAGDDTDGHVDQLARFVSARQIVVAVEDDSHDINFEPLQANRRRLEACRDANGQPYEIIPLPVPLPIHYNNQRVPASYCNFYIANGCVLVPQFSDRADQHALDVLKSLFPDRDVIGVACRELVWGLGALHCMTQQQPVTRPA